jgi:hypothetical protein
MFVSESGTNLTVFPKRDGKEKANKGTSMFVEAKSNKDGNFFPSDKFEQINNC